MIRQLIGRRNESRPPGLRGEPERIVLGVRADHRPSSKPPVRVFLGTEPGQYRAERVFVWSIEQRRDPSRSYEIYLMKELRGFERRRWLTGFTNYRFAIPHFAGGRGRAIYNDVDQIYLVDPAELFDLDMQGHGFLAISSRDTSVMLIDCERMASVWTLEAAQRERRKAIEAKARDANLWGPLASEWNSRDLEYVQGRSKVLHYTTIHTQPWQPFPERFVYQHNPVAHVWLDEERTADAARFQLFDLATPSSTYRSLLDHLAQTQRHEVRSRSPRSLPSRQIREVLEFAEKVNATTTLEFALSRSTERLSEAPFTSSLPRVTRYNPTGGAPALFERFDGVVCLGGLELVSDEDASWFVDSLFGRARHFVYVATNASAAQLPAVYGQRRVLRRDLSWWRPRFEEAARRYPRVHWKLVVLDRTLLGQITTHAREGGFRLRGVPKVWLLADHKAGHISQSLGIAEALGWPFEIKQLSFNARERWDNRVLGPTLLSLDKAHSTPLEPPWPDLVIATGRRPVPVARWISRQSGGQTRLVQLGRKGGDRVEWFDLVVSCSHFRLPLHPRRIEIVAPLNRINPEVLHEAARLWSNLFAGAPRPHVGLLVGGTSAMHVIDARTARRMAEEVRAFAEAAGGSAFAVTSPRTGEDVTSALLAGLGNPERVHRWTPEAKKNPYLGYLALADVLVVTGDSESMLAEAAATTRPLYIYPLPERPPTWKRGLASRITARAYSRPRKGKGTVRPQQRLEYLCARLIERGLVRPPRDLNELYRRLIEGGFARRFGEPLDVRERPPLHETDLVADEIRALLGCPRGWQPGGVSGAVEREERHAAAN